MASNTLTDTNISDTYVALLHARGEALPSSGQVLVYDGSGNVSSLRLGRSGNGAYISGTLSANALTVNGISYPSVDGSAGTFLTTNGAGGLTFSSIPLSSVPDLSPSPAGTYVGLSAITVDSKGRITDVVSANSGAALTSVTYYATPIDIYSNSSTSNVAAFDLSCDQTNKPSDATYALIQIYNEIGWSDNNDKACSCYVLINGAQASIVGSVYGGGEIFKNSSLSFTTWAAKLDGSDNISVQIARTFAAGTANRTSFVQIRLLGYATYNTLTNP